MKNIFVIVGSSGSGKTSIGKKAFGSDNELVSHTTRAIRPKEQNGRDYHFVTLSEMKKLIENDELVEYSEYNGHLYGISKAEIKNKTDKYETFFITDRNGLDAITKLYPNNTISIFIDVPITQLKNRLVKRNEQNIESRLALYSSEQKLKTKTKYVIENNNFKQAVRDIKLIALKHRSVEK